MLKFAILTILSVPSIRAALIHKEIASALIAAEDTVTLKKTFKKYEKEQDHYFLSLALADVAEDEAHMPKVVECLRIAHDPSPEDKMCVKYLVYSTLFEISIDTNTESFTNVITCFKTSDIKPLAAIRFRTLGRYDAVDVLKGVMTKSPELITHDLPSWIAFHYLDRNSAYYGPVLEEAFGCLTSFATQSVLEEALAIVKKNEHYKTVYKSGHTEVPCCGSQKHFPQDLFNKLNDLLVLVKARNARIRKTLTFLPTVLVDLMLEYVAVSDRSNSSRQCLIS